MATHVSVAVDVDTALVRRAERRVRSGRVHGRPGQEDVAALTAVSAEFQAQNRSAEVGADLGAFQLGSHNRNVTWDIIHQFQQVNLQQQVHYYFQCYFNATSMLLKMVTRWR